MRCLVVHAHPNPDSFSAELRCRAIEGLHAGGHEVDVIDLYDPLFDPCMSDGEHVAYDTIATEDNGGHPDEVVGGHIELIRRAEALVFVYPTWWSGQPAVMKGWFDRTLLPGVAFDLVPAKGGVKTVPTLQHIERLVGITTYGSKRRDVFLLGDAGRRTIARTIRMMCGLRCKTKWLALYQLDGVEHQERAEFLDRVSTELASL